MIYLIDNAEDEIYWRLEAAEPRPRWANGLYERDMLGARGKYLGDGRLHGQIVTCLPEHAEEFEEKRCIYNLLTNALTPSGLQDNAPVDVGIISPEGDVYPCREMHHFNIPRLLE